MSQQESLVIPGEPRLSRRIREAANRDALGRAAVLSGQGDLAAAARFTAAALLCRGGDKPCGVCPDCRKVLREVHPDVLTVTDPEHKNVSVEILRNVTADASVLPNEGQRKVYIFPDCSLLDGKARVTVRNEGATIPAEELPLLFERFHKSDKSRSLDKDGVGLGLYIVKTILEQHKEKINVTSENGVTAFSFSLVAE